MHSQCPLAFLSDYTRRSNQLKINAHPNGTLLIAKLPCLFHEQLEKGNGTSLAFHEQKRKGTKGKKGMFH